MANITITESLATKYRPKLLKHLYGQPSVRMVLEGMVKKGTFSQTIMLTGPSGCGKTTTAQLINRYINCDTNNACGECESCLKVNHPDLLEVNLANTRGIDDVRSVVASANYMPKFKKRVILLDEVHAATPQAASCLLIPIETPPKNTLYILATTNPEKVMPTIIGRCLMLELKQLSEESLVKRLYQIGKLEGVDFSKMDEGIETLELLASLCIGGMRDAIQMLEKLLFALASGTTISPKMLMSQHIASSEVDVEKGAATLLHALLSFSMKKTIKATTKVESPRQLISKTRWLINYLLEAYVGKAQYQPVSARYWDVLIAKDPKFRLNYANLLMLQSILSDLEVVLNTCNIDAGIMLMSACGKFLRECAVETE